MAYFNASTCFKTWGFNLKMQDLRIPKEICYFLKCITKLERDNNREIIREHLNCLALWKENSARNCIMLRYNISIESQRTNSKEIKNWKNLLDAFFLVSEDYLFLSVLS